MYLSEGRTWQFGSLLDGNALADRCYFGHPDRSSDRGIVSGSQHQGTATLRQDGQENAPFAGLRSHGGGGSGQLGTGCAHRQTTQSVLIFRRQDIQRSHALGARNHSRCAPLSGRSSRASLNKELSSPTVLRRISIGECTLAIIRIYSFPETKILTLTKLSNLV